MAQELQLQAKQTSADKNSNYDSTFKRDDDLQFEKFDDLGESYNQGSVARKESAKPAKEADKTFNDRGSPLPDLGATQKTVM